MEGNRADMLFRGGDGDELPPARAGKMEKLPGIGGEEAKPSVGGGDEDELPRSGAGVHIVELEEEPRMMQLF